MTSRQVFITGAGSGIGAGLAMTLARCGHRVIISDLESHAAQAVAEAVRQAGYQAAAVELDITQPSQIKAAVAQAGPIDVLINNAGLQHVARLEEFPEERWRMLVAVMLTGAADMTRAVLPGMRHAGYGRIINIGSIHCLVASAFKSAYVAAKHGLVGFSKTIALETADVDITINTICPAYVRTPLVDRQIAAQAREHGLPEDRVISDIMLKPMPKKTFISIEEVAALIEYLMSDAARNVTAQAIAIDGGWTAQ
jgi:3-hydroxybutyrate dehydrogenase